MATRRSVGRAAREGYVVAFDDVTELVSAQRRPAGVECRAPKIAHEIKNPC